MKFKTSLKGFSLIELSIVILIIGILIAGVFQANNMVKKFKLSAARALTQSSPVQGITGLTLWLDATAEKGFIASESVDATAISTWYDVNPQRLLANNFTQSSSSLKPRYYEDGISGLPAIKFDGTDDSLSKLSFARDDMFSYDEGTFFFAIKSLGNISLTASLLWCRSLDNSSDVSMFATSPYSGGGAAAFYFGLNGSIVTAALSNSFYNHPQVLMGLHNSSGYNEIRLNGALTQSGSVANQTLTSTAAFNAYIGGLGSVYEFPGYIGEVIIYNRALNAEEKSAIESYLKKKWGI